MSFITPSLWLKQLLSTTYLKNHFCTVIYNGIDTEIFKENHSETLEERYLDKKVLLGVANKWEARKGLLDFIRLSKRLSSEYQIILIGLTDRQISKLPSNIVGINRTDNADQLAQYYTLAYAFINPTYEDNYPTTNLEALSCNTPVIAYDTGGNKEVDGVEIIKQGDIDELIQKIETLQINKKYASTSFSKERFVEEMISYFNN